MMRRPTAFPYYRDHDIVAPLEKFAPSILRGLAEEAYWFHWQSSFDGQATIRVARLGDEAEFSRLHRGSHFGGVRMCRRPLHDRLGADRGRGGRGRVLVSGQMRRQARA